jgi:acyl-coenzyme A thioesterase PaaI-like protein
MRRPVAFTEGENTCFGCGSDNPLGLRLQFFETDDGVECDWTAPPHLAGAPGIIHGGIQGTVLDEVLCMTAFAKHGTGVVTGELTIRYRKPVPTGVPLRIDGRIVARDDRSYTITGTIRRPDTPDVLTEARGRFFIARDKDT